MTPLEALNLMYQAAGMARLTRMEHVQIDQAAQALKEALEKPAEAAVASEPTGPHAVT